MALPDRRGRLACRQQPDRCRGPTPARRTGGAATAGLVLAAWLGACSPPAPGTDLFPLDPGHRWTYDVRTEWENNTIEHARQVMSTEGAESVQGLSGSLWRRRSDSGVDYWIRRDDTGIARVASKSDLDAEPHLDERPHYVLKAPIEPGTRWQSSTTAYLLKRRNEFPPEIRHTHPKVPMTYTIAAVGEGVTTRAGRFEGCVRVDGDATVRLFADPVAGWKDLPLTTREWYCPGVGLARLERHEPANSPFLSGGTVTMELVSWQ